MKTSMMCEEDRRTLILNLKLDLLDVGYNTRWGVELMGVGQVIRGWWWNSYCAGYEAVILWDAVGLVRSAVMQTPNDAVRDAVERAIAVQTPDSTTFGK